MSIVKVSAKLSAIKRQQTLELYDLIKWKMESVEWKMESYDYQHLMHARALRASKP